MKKQIFISYIMIAIIIGASQLSFTNSLAEQVLQEATENFHQGLADLENQIQEYDQLAIDFTSEKKSIELLQKTHLETRLAFKKIEFLLEYYDRYSIKKYINGAPLPSVEPKVAELVEIEPEGLQVLDELVFGANIFEEKEQIKELTKKLKYKYQSIYRYQLKLRVTHRHLFEAMRQELVRVFTLGVTGFDTPGSTNALPEAKKALEGIQTTIKIYTPLISPKNQNLISDIENLFDDAILFLKKNNDFESFDRLVFLKSYINPLYQKIHEAHLILQIETIEETNDQVQPTNYHAIGIFDENFFNPSYYAGINLKTPQAQKRKALGKLLFFDPILSSNNERACSSCHNPNKAFTDGLSKSLAINGKTHIQRNSPTLINSVFSERYFYDLREPNLERQIKHVVQDSMEFSTDFFQIIEKLNQSQTYKKLFAEAYNDFPSYTLSQWSISDALANYVGSLNSFNSPFDQYVRGEKNEIDESVKRGFNLFMGKASCGTCHFAPTFNGTVPPIYDESESEILGVPKSKDTLNAVIDADLGRFRSSRPIDQAPFYALSFKTVTVRNIAKTAPYMHNGVYDTLEEVIDFYNRGGGVGLGIEVPYQTLPDSPLNLKENEISDLVAFLESLTDYENFKDTPIQLPIFEGNEKWNQRKIGGNY